MIERTVMTASMEETCAIFGSYDSNIRIIENAYGVTVVNRESDLTAGNAIIISGTDEENVSKAASVISYLKNIALLGTTEEKMSLTSLTIPASASQCAENRSRQRRSDRENMSTR